MRLLNVLGASLLFLVCIIFYLIFWIPNKILEFIDTCIVKGLFASIYVISGETDKLTIEEIHEEGEEEEK